MKKSTNKKFSRAFILLILITPFSLYFFEKNRDFYSYVISMLLFFCIFISFVLGPFSKISSWYFRNELRGESQDKYTTRQKLIHDVTVTYKMFGIWVENKNE